MYQNSALNFYCFLLNLRLMLNTEQTKNKISLSFVRRVSKPFGPGFLKVIKEYFSKGSLKDSYIPQFNISV